jgi:transposase
MLAGGTEDKEHAMSQKLDTSPAVIGIDIGKNSFHIVGQNRRGAIVLRQKWSRGQVEARLANLPPCRIGMEACVGAHHLSRTLRALGHDPRLMPAKYVRPYSKGQKNDYRDAEAIAEAVQRPTMKFVATKTADQLDLQALHRVRERFVGQRTGIINQIRAFMLERGIAVRQGLRFLRAELPGILATRTDALSPRMLRILEDLMADWRHLDARIEELKVGFAQRRWLKQDDAFALWPILAIWPPNLGVPVVNQIRTYWWCSPPRTGRQRMVPASLTARETGASFSKDKCVLISL